MIGVVIDGCPANLPLLEEDINAALLKRQPGKNPYTSPRKEADLATIISGVFEGKTTGAPITILIENTAADSSAYNPIERLYRPGHANFTYLAKYGIFDHRGGGRASARETAARVAAGAVAKKLLEKAKIECVAYLAEIGDIKATTPLMDTLPEKIALSPIFCPDPIAEQKMLDQLLQIKEEKDSLGGIVACMAKVPVGLGDPVYQKLEACLAFAMLSIPASKGFEIGEGFEAAKMRGSSHNDPFTLDSEGNPIPATNHAGGTLGGISTGAPLFFRVAFKPTSSIQKEQQTVSVDKKLETLKMPATGKHDPCVAIRAVPVVEAMAALVLADAWLMQKLQVNN
jgi:chorismate synthase